MKPGRFLTYDEVVRALQDAKRLGDCVPKDLKETARAIMAKRPLEGLILKEWPTKPSKKARAKARTL